jgi:peroxiredoxin Q/BCP
MLEIGSSIPEFELPANGGRTIKSSDLKGKNLVLYFYPRDNTPGCTKEGQAFRDEYPAFQKLDTEIVGVSRESVKSHDNFAAKYDFPFPLLSDQEETLCNAFDVIKDKSMYGRKVRGIERSTFIFDKEGKLVKEYRKVNVNGHAQEVLEVVEGMNG